MYDKGNRYLYKLKKNPHLPRGNSECRSRWRDFGPTRRWPTWSDPPHQTQPQRPDLQQQTVSQYKKMRIFLGEKHICGSGSWRQKIAKKIRIKSPKKNFFFYTKCYKISPNLSIFRFLLLNIQILCTNFFHSLLSESGSALLL